MLGKNFAPLAEKLNNVEWGEFLLKDLFEIKSNPQLNKDNFSFSENGAYPYFTRTVFNNGILGYVDYFDEEHKISGGCLAVGMIGMQFFYMEKDFYAGQFTKRAVPKNFSLTKKTALFFISLLSQYQKIFQEKLVRDFEKTFYQIKIKLPTKNGEIDFEFMEKFITELEAERIVELDAYLTAAGLKDFILTDEEEFVLENLNSCILKKFLLKDLFNEIYQGRRLKKDDQISGKIPFVMSGVTNCGVVGYISNPVASFPKNSITVDIFGNTFYRNYDFGAGDDTGVYWNSEKNYSAKTMLFFATAIQKFLTGKFSYGKKLRSSQSKNFEIYLPTKDGEIDYEFMEKFITAVQKIIIADVVKYSEEKISAYRQAANK